jgi:hypothetical protein
MGQSRGQRTAEVVRLTKLGAKVVDRLERWAVMDAPTGQRIGMGRAISLLPNKRHQTISNRLPVLLVAG